MKGLLKKAKRRVLPFLLLITMMAQSIASSQGIYADDNVYLEINGFQVSTVLEAFRTIYSVSDPAGKTEEVGLVYGVTDFITEADMKVGSSNDIVKVYAATPKGEASICYSDHADAKSYIRTMDFIKTAEFYNSNLSVRAYAKLKDGTYVYSDISVVSVYKIANVLYQNSLMSTIGGHNYLYDNVLSVVNPSYQTVEYKYKNILVPAESSTERSTSVTIPEEPTSGVSTDIPKGFVNATQNDWTTSGDWGCYFGDWNGTAEGAYSGSGNPYKVYVKTANPGTDWLAQVRYQAAATPDHTYKVTVSVSADKAGSIGIKEDLSNESSEQVYTDIPAGKTVTLTGTYTVTTDAIRIMFELGRGVEAGTTITFNNISIEDVTPETPTIPVQDAPKNIVLDSYYDGIDVASSSTTGQGSETSDKLFDGNINTKMYTGDAPSIRIAWKMKQAVVLKKYTFTTANDSASYPTRTPASWRLYGSNNATTWTQIDTVTNGGMEAKNFASYTYETDVQQSFQYFLLLVETNGVNSSARYYGLQLAEISMFGDVSTANNDIGEDLQKYYDSIDNNNTNTSGHNSEVPANLFDGDTSTKMFSAAGSPTTIGWKEKQSVTVYSYSLTTANDNSSYPRRNPRSWVLYGSTDGKNWEAIDIVANSGMEDVNYKTYTYTVDRVGTYKYFRINITGFDGSSFQLSEISLKGATVNPCKYDIMFTGDWDLIRSQTYKDDLVKLFYNSYPRLYARWGDGSEPTTITYLADKNYDGVAYCAGTTVCVSVNYANNNPYDLGFFSHEITHSVQQYGGKLVYDVDSPSGWWTENMANYGGFRYFHWSTPKYVQIYEASDKSLQDWGWQKYGNNKWFFAYMDAKYPTRKNADGSLNYGLIDSINRLIKTNNTGKEYDDNPYDTNTEMNRLVKQITGYDCMESLRLRFVQELQNGTWKFTGFADYVDNWITEDIEGVDNPEYPMIGEKTHGNKTASQLSSAVTSGTNLCNGASIYDCSGYTNNNEQASYLIDGNLNTKWCATTSSVTNPTYKLNGVAHWAIIDLGTEKTFNTYTLYNTQSKEGYGNATEWEILVSNDAKNWTSVDYQGNNNSAISSFNIGTQKARYVFVKVFTPDNGVGTLRLYEFQLYNK